MHEQVFLDFCFEISLDIGIFIGNCLGYFLDVQLMHYVSQKNRVSIFLMIT